MSVRSSRLKAVLFAGVLQRWREVGVSSRSQFFDRKYAYFFNVNAS